MKNGIRLLVQLWEPLVPNYDLTYLTTDSIQEGVGSSQILPLVVKMSERGLKVNLISYEKGRPSHLSEKVIAEAGIDWTQLHFDRNTKFAPLKRLRELTGSISSSNVIHARSDIPAMSGILSDMGPVLWDIRSLWTDQRLFIESNRMVRFGVLGARTIERFNAKHSSAISTLTNAVVPELESRYKKLSKIRTVVPTAVDLRYFSFSPQMPRSVRMLFSGTYNAYYDLQLSSVFCDALKKKIAFETYWARPMESPTRTLGLGEDRVLELNRSEMWPLISASSFGMSVCRNDAGVSLKAAVPTKIAEFLSVGRPVVINKGLGDFDEIFRAFDVGVILDGSSENMRAGVEKILTLIEDPETPYRCRAVAEKYFSLDVGVENYLEIYGKLHQ